MKKLINDVKALHQKMGAPCPEDLDYKYAIFRAKFLLEELTEMINACGLHIGVTNEKGVDTVQIFNAINKPINEEEILDGLVDLIYVAIGTAIYFGYTNKIIDRLDCEYTDVCTGIDCNKCDNTKTLLELAWDRVQDANMKKVPVKHAGESKRGTQFDLLKPPGWQKPVFADLLQIIKERTKK